MKTIYVIIVVISVVGVLQGARVVQAGEINPGVPGGKFLQINPELFQHLLRQRQVKSGGAFLEKDQRV